MPVTAQALKLANRVIYLTDRFIKPVAGFVFWRKNTQPKDAFDVIARASKDPEILVALREIPGASEAIDDVLRNRSRLAQLNDRYGRVNRTLKKIVSEARRIAYERRQFLEFSEYHKEYAASNSRGMNAYEIQEWLKAYQKIRHIKERRHPIKAIMEAINEVL